ncbi:MAG: hypothetical protein K5945_07805 [Bacteroidaceae bacterium]|nr:hypothetical protein [Bacteroidaceae bacterium]
MQKSVEESEQKTDHSKHRLLRQQASAPATASTGSRDSKHRLLRQQAVKTILRQVHTLAGA